MPDLKMRLLGAALVGLPFLAFLCWGSLPFAIFLLILSFIGLYEWCSALLKELKLFPFALAGGITIYTAGFYLGYRGIFLGTLFFLLLTMASLVVLEVGVEKASFLFLGTVYISYAFLHLAYLRTLQAGLTLVLLVVLSVWASDILAYFIGLNFGKNKLAPQISPHKTLEGWLGGSLGALATTVAFALAGLITYVFAISLGLIVAVFGLLGDLFESSIKRHFGLKDSGHIFLSHGGVLDRFDSLMLVSIAAYYLVRCFS